jgi:hypothetical protein
VLKLFLHLKTLTQEPEINNKKCFMPVTSKNKKTGRKKTLDVIDPKAGNYEKHPFL